MRNMTSRSNYKKLLSYLAAQRVILFLVFYEYLTRINRNPKFKTENSKCFLNVIDSCEYDANGNMTKRNGVTIGYTCFLSPIYTGLHLRGDYAKK